MTTPAQVDSPVWRQAGPDLLSVALMDARNHLLWLWDQLAQTLQAPDFVTPDLPSAVPPLWLLGHGGWLQEWWIARNLQRDLGSRADGAGVRLPSVETSADAWWRQPPVHGEASRWYTSQPGLERTRHYLLMTLETSLELLDKAARSDDGLHVFRLALFHEDAIGESMINLAQTLGLPLQIALPGPMALRPPLVVPAARWQMGQAAGEGFRFEAECPAHPVDVPEFEIDTQPVAWSQFVEFVDDGGYDRQELWAPQGWDWLQRRPDGGRAPRYVDQIGVASGAVMQTRFGQARRMLGGQPAMHLSWWEADAWCRWAGRRLPSEVEWELAAHHADRRGFRWGDVWEWTGTTARAYPGYVAGPEAGELSAQFDGGHKALRGASFATRQRMKSARFRRFARPDADHLFVGFRSCAF